MNPTYIAWVAHEANRTLQAIQCDPSVPTSVDWVALDDETRSSVIDGVEKILSGEIETPEQSHENWLVFKMDRGWHYGPVKDEKKLEHPCMLNYEDLPSSQRVKDRLYFAIVKALAEADDPAEAPA